MTKVVRNFSDIVDNVLKEDDIDDDGYLTYAEYVLARRREEMREAVRTEHWWTLLGSYFIGVVQYAAVIRQQITSC